MNHRWSGWPGAWCLDCGKEDPMERIIADGKVDDDMNPLPGALTEEDLKPCPEPGSRRHDPYRTCHKQPEAENGVHECHACEALWVDRGDVRKWRPQSCPERRPPRVD